MRLFFQTIAFGFLLLTLASCSVQKRSYMPGYYIASHIEVPESHNTDSNESDGSGISNHSTFTNVSLNKQSSLLIKINNQDTRPEEKSSRSDISIKILKRKQLVLNETVVLHTLENGIIKGKVLEKGNYISIPVHNLKQTDNTASNPISKWQMFLLFCIVGLLLVFLGWGITGLLTALLILGIAVVLAFLILIVILGSIGDSAWG